MSTGRMYQQLTDIVTNPRNTFVVCDYSRACQVACEPTEQVCGALCSCAACLMTPIVCCGLIMLGATPHGGLDCKGLLSASHNLGAYTARSLIRSLGFLLGVACYPFEKCNRLEGIKPNLFCCPVSREAIDDTHFCSTPKQPAYEDEKAPQRQMMS